MTKTIINENPGKRKVESFESGLSDGFHRALSSNIRLSDLSPRELAKVLGVSYQLIINGSNLNIKPVKFSAARLLPLMLVTGRFDVLGFFARSCGFLLIKAPDIKTDKDFFAAACDLSGKWGRLCEIMRKYFRENPADRKKILSGLIDSCREITSSAAGLGAAIEKELKRG